MDKSTPAPGGDVGTGSCLPPLPPRYPEFRPSSVRLEFTNTSSACASQPPPTSNQTTGRLSNDDSLMQDLSPRNPSYLRANSQNPSINNNFDSHIRLMEPRNRQLLSDEIEKNVFNMGNNAEKFMSDDSYADLSPRNPSYHRANSQNPSIDNNFDSHIRSVEPRNHQLLSDETEKNVFSMGNNAGKFMSGDRSADPSLCGSSQSAFHPVQGFQRANVALGSIQNPITRHQRSQSVDGSTIFRPEFLVSSGEGTSSMVVRKATSDAKLAEIALVDPKRAMRILANRQSAARSKQRKVRYIQELESKGDTASLAAENNELKLRVQTMEQHFQLLDALNDALREEINHLRMVVAQRMPANRGIMNSAVVPSHRDAQELQKMQSLNAANHFQPFQSRSEHQHQYQLQAHQAPQQEQQLLLPALNESNINFNSLRIQK